MRLGGRSHARDEVQVRPVAEIQEARLWHAWVPATKAHFRRRGNAQLHVMSSGTIDPGATSHK
jgi:hypothetical protein